MFITDQPQTKIIIISTRQPRLVVLKATFAFKIFNNFGMSATHNLMRHEKNTSTFYETFSNTKNKDI